MNENSEMSGEYLSQYHAWLRLMARLQVNEQGQRRFDASDIVQQTLLEAWQGEADFRGECDGQRVAWLRTIMGRVISREIRKYDGTAKRDPAREVYLQQSLERSSIMLGGLLASDGPSPSQHADAREQHSIIAEVLETLPDDYRDVIVLRNLQGLSHVEVALKLDRSESAVRMLWLRALKALKDEVLLRQ